ncbi:molybdopterin cofactor-binding domain-containing protein [Saccharopolyspora sp. NPDC050642]|uniref:molybdopterin cofactor-binding domain-containing protein n=1 Tax=Saccharopolyspora sp. NPDC050642 TaxID=3157099 RepID=UPI0033E761D9
MTSHRAPRATTRPPDEPGPGLTGRRRFLGYLLAAPTLVAAARLAGPPAAEAAVPSPGLTDAYDLSDALTHAALPTSNLITVAVNPDGTVSFALHRAEVGQGITTAVAMLIAEEMSLPLEKVRITLADARSELVFNQLTGGSNTIHAIYTPVRLAAAVARERMKLTAAQQWHLPVAELDLSDGVITHRSGKRATYGSLAKTAASPTTREFTPELKPAAEFTIIGRPQNRIDALAAVTGRKQFAMDLDVPGAKPTMVRRAPTINGTARSIRNADQVLTMPGITDVAIISTGVAVRGETFGQCIDAVRALDVTWAPGTVDGESDETLLRKLKAATPPVKPALPLTTAVDAEFTFAFASNTPLETNCAVADVRKDRAEIWSSLKVPIIAKQQIAQRLGLPETAVTVHVVEGGGSFGRHLFHDAAMEAAEASRAFGKPVRLMWHRTDDFRHGRAHPMCFSRIRATCAAGEVLTFEQYHTSVKTDFGHGFGELITGTVTEPELGNYSVAQTIFLLSQHSPYAFGVTTQLLNEVPLEFHTGSMRNVYSPNVRCAQELVVDRLAAEMGKDPLAFRREFAREERYRKVLDVLAEKGRWGRSLPAGVAQGVALAHEYKAVAGALVEIDARPETVGREVPVHEGVTGPRVTRVTFVVDPGLCINPRGLEAQMLGGINDGIATALTFGLHIEDGLPLEGSWDNGFYTRQWNVPPEVEIIIMPDSGDDPGGAGELAVAPTMAAVACAYARATGTMPTTFPINHHDPLRFEPLPREPSIPQSPTDGLDKAF